MNEVFEQMLSHYDISSTDAHRNALFEVTQQVALAGLQRGGFFEKAAFYGGTCLRIFHGLHRFSEDLDFSLLVPDDTFDLKDYFPVLIAEFNNLGREVTITKKDKKNVGRVESAFLKDTTDVYNLSFQTERSIKIKIEVDTNPPVGFETEQKLLMQPYSFMTRCFTLPDLFAGKMHALIFRQWGQRVKGRDWYDFEWYIRNGVPLNFNHFKERAREFNGLDISKQDFISMLKDRLKSADITLVKKDVLPFLQFPDETNIWSNEYFCLLADKLCFVR